MRRLCFISLLSFAVISCITISCNRKKLDIETMLVGEREKIWVEKSNPQNYHVFNRDLWTHGKGGLYDYFNRTDSIIYSDDSSTFVIKSTFRTFLMCPDGSYNTRLWELFGEDSIDVGGYRCKMLKITNDMLILRRTDPLLNKVYKDTLIGISEDERHKRFWKFQDIKYINFD